MEQSVHVGEATWFSGNVPIQRFKNAFNLISFKTSFPQFKVGVSWHPSHSPISVGLGEEERALLAPVSCPQLFMPGQGDHANTRPGGLAHELLGDKLTITEFNDMQHGWTIRGGEEDGGILQITNQNFSQTCLILLWPEM